MRKIIAGIQQIGIGVSDVQDAFRFYRTAFGMDIPVFEEAAQAALMLPYTGGIPRQRHAILAINLRGGGGFEIWQYTDRVPVTVATPVQLGDFGIFAAKLKTDNVSATYEKFKSSKLNLISPVLIDPCGQQHFFLKDPWDNIFDIVPGKDWFAKAKSYTGGPSGCIIGVSDMDKSIQFYSEILGYDKIIYDKSGAFDDLQYLPSGNQDFRRVLITHTQPRKGSFSRLLGSSSIELIEARNRKPVKIFENRLWGDLGFIHLCFDVNGMEEIKKQCSLLKHPFTVDSANSFDMGEAAGHFSYIEDPDGTLIEFVETHKIPILKKIGWYLNLKKRNPEKPLPDWMLRSMALNRVRD